MFVREDRAETAVLRMAHGKVSALDAGFCEALRDEIAAIGQSDAGAFVLTGTGSAFSAGVDLFKILDGGRPYLAQFLPALESLLTTLLTLPKPAVAAVNGHAIAGGCILAAACDVRIMAGTGRIGIPELIVGVPFPPLPFEIVSARLSPGTLRTLVYTGRTLLAEDAVAVGLADEAVAADRLLSRACDVARELAAIQPQAFALTKRSFVNPILDRVRQAAAINAAVADAWASPAVHAAIRVYLEKTIAKK